MTARVMFSGEVFAHSGEGSWHFVRVPADVAADVRDLLTGPPGGFGSVKKPVRSAEGILADDVVQVELGIVEGDEGDS